MKATHHRKTANDRAGTAAANTVRSMRLAVFVATVLCALAVRTATSGDLDLVFGSIPAGDGVTITFDVTVNATTPPETIRVEAHGLVTGGNFFALYTDDPDVGGATDPTVTDILMLPRLTLELVPGGVRIRGAGAPGLTHDIQHSGSLLSPDWQPVGSVTADPSGRFEIRDMGTDLLMYYRSRLR